VPTAKKSGAARRKLIAFDAETFNALELLRRDRMATFDELADEAFRDLLNKHGRPTDLRTALRRSVSASGASEEETSAAAPPRAAATPRAASTAGRRRKRPAR
jgi:hypothetical protein